MALNKGEIYALFTLLQVNSGLRVFVLTGGTNPATPPPDGDTVASRVKKYLVANKAIDPSHFDQQTVTNLTKLYDPMLGAVTNDPGTIAEALDDTYIPDTGPCPDGDDQTDFITALSDGM